MKERQKAEADPGFLERGCAKDHVPTYSAPSVPSAKSIMDVVQGPHPRIRALEALSLVRVHRQSEFIDRYRPKMVTMSCVDSPWPLLDPCSYKAPSFPGGKPQPKPPSALFQYGRFFHCCRCSLSYFMNLHLNYHFIVMLIILFHFF